MENTTNKTTIDQTNETLKKEWVKPEMIEIEVMSGKGAAPDGALFS